jgi:hypothetical protein
MFHVVGVVCSCVAFGNRTELMMRPLRLSILLFLFIIGGCSPEVIVIDRAGIPVKGAEVRPVSPSITGSPVMTGATGKASVPMNAGGQEAKWIAVKKAGFDPVQVDVPSHWPLRITLVPAGTAKLGVQLTTRP